MYGLSLSSCRDRIHSFAECIHEDLVKFLKAKPREQQLTRGVSLFYGNQKNLLVIEFEDFFLGGWTGDSII